MKDFNGNELKIDDTVVFILSNEFLKGKIIGFTNQKVKISNKYSYNGYNNIFSDRVIKV